MPSYSVHGLTLSSTVPLPGLAPAGPADATDITCGFAEAPAPEPDGVSIDLPSAGALGDDRVLVQLFQRPADDGWRLRYLDGTTFDLRADGCVVQSYTPHGATLDDTLTYLYGPVLALVLRMRGVLALHASAALVDGEAVLFVGGNGAGKSTLAAACARAGLAILSDDVVALREAGGRWWASSAYDHVRLWAASEEALFGAGTLPLLTPHWDKRVLPLRGHGYVHAEGCAPVRAVFVLDAREAGAAASRLHPIAPREALLLLVAHAAASRLMTARLRALELEPLGRFVTACAPRRLVLPDDMAQLGAAVAMVTVVVREAQA